MRSVTLAAALALLAAPAFAQTTTNSTTSTTAPAAMTPAAPVAGETTTTTTTTSKHMTMQQKFDAANVTHDGHLTKEQAEAGDMKMVVKHFDEIDNDKKGYVTLDEIKTFHHAHKKMKKAAE